MQRENNHMTDEELLLNLDGELSTRRAQRVHAHLAICPSCFARMEEFASATAGLNQIYVAAQNSHNLPHATSRANLRRRIAAESRDSTPFFRFPRWATAFSAQTWAYACAVVLLLIGFASGWLRVPASPRSADAVPAYANGAGPVLPDARLTPGAIRPVTAGQICLAGGPAEGRPPVAMQRAVFHEYGMDGAPARNYEVDHLITPALGGTDDIRNLWPEPYASTEWNAHVKDELENHLHNLVCDGKLDLATAQRDMASNWIRAYKKYFHSDEPIPRTSELMEDRRHTPKS